MYPETMGVPLEEMDEIFGEESFSDDEDEDEDLSETATLVRDADSAPCYTPAEGSRPETPTNDDARKPRARGWFRSLMGFGKDHYTLVEGNHGD